MARSICGLGVLSSPPDSPYTFMCGSPVLVLFSDAIRIELSGAPLRFAVAAAGFDAAGWIQRPLKMRRTFLHINGHRFFCASVRFTVQSFIDFKHIRSEGTCDMLSFVQSYTCDMLKIVRIYKHIRTFRDVFGRVFVLSVV